MPPPETTQNIYQNTFVFPNIVVASAEGDRTAATLNAIIAKYTSEVILLFDGTWLIDADVSFTTNFSFIFVPNALLQSTTNNLVTFRGRINAGKEQIFDGIRTGMNFSQDFFARWWTDFDECMSNISLGSAFPRVIVDQATEVTGAVTHEQDTTVEFKNHGYLYGPGSYDVAGPIINDELGDSFQGALTVTGLHYEIPDGDGTVNLYAHRSAVTNNTAPTTITRLFGVTHGRWAIVVFEDDYTTVDFSSGVYIIGNNGQDYEARAGDFMIVYGYSSPNPAAVNDVVYAVVHRVEDAVQTIADGDATPDLGRGRLFETANTGPTTITDFDGIPVGEERIVMIDDGNTTIDLSGTNLKGNAGVDLAPATQYDVLKVLNLGTYRHCFISEA